MFKKILVPIDLAHIEKSKAMIDQAKELAAANQGEITLLNVLFEIPPYAALEIPPGSQEKTKKHSKAELEKLAKSHGLPESTKIELRMGNAANEILNLAEKDNTDLIIIASHQPEIADYLLGSVASKVVRHARCTVMVLR